MREKLGTIFSLATKTEAMDSLRGGLESYSLLHTPGDSLMPNSKH